MKINLFTVSEVADILKISYDKALGLVKYGELKAFKVGRSFRVDEDDLFTYIAKQKKQLKM